MSLERAKSLRRQILNGTVTRRISDDVAGAPGRDEARIGLERQRVPRRLLER